MTDNLAKQIEEICRGLLWSSSDGRPYKFLEIFTPRKIKKNPALFWSVLHREWNGFDAIPTKQMQKVLRLAQPHWRVEYMDAEQRAFYDSLPDTFTAYRGVDQEHWSDIAMSWTLDFDVAASFAGGHRWFRHKRPAVLEAELKKSDVLGAYPDRNEAEVIFACDTLPFHYDTHEPLESHDVAT